MDDIYPAYRRSRARIVRSHIFFFSIFQFHFFLNNLFHSNISPTRLLTVNKIHPW
jgi:hypothetical protein